MPGRDGSGPLGGGSMTGRGMGYCVRPTGPGSGWQYGRSLGRGAGFGCGLGYGPGRGLRMSGGRGYGGSQVVVNVTEKEYLKSEEKRLNDNLQDIRSRLSALDVDKSV